MFPSVCLLLLFIVCFVMWEFCIFFFFVVRFISISFYGFCVIAIKAFPPRLSKVFPWFLIVFL